MDPHQNALPAGVMGELVVVGDGLARGYTDPTLDKDRFIHITMAGERDDHETGGGGSSMLVRAYRTGDQVRVGPKTRQMEFFGRLDMQVKIRGHRVEPAEVEHTMLEHPLVRIAAVVVRSGEAMGDSELVGFVEAEEAKSYKQRDQGDRIVSRINESLRDALLKFMVPSQIIVMEHMPSNSSGELDRKAPRSMARVAPKIEAARELVPPRNEVEAVLCEEFGEVLSVQVGITDNFFSAGGHSFMATRLVARLSRRLDSRVTLCFGQNRLWFIEQVNSDASWIILIGVRLRGPFNTDALERALAALQGRHKTLRTTVLQDDDAQVMQVVHAESEYPKPKLRVVDVPAVVIKEEQAKPLDLSSEAGWRSSLLRSGPENHVLIVVLHHLIYNSWSIDVLARELGISYAAAVRGRDPLSYKQDEQLAEHKRQLQYRTQNLQDSREAELPTDFPRPAMLSGRAGAVPFVIEGPLYDRLRAFSRTHQIATFAALFAVFRAAHYRLTGVEDATTESLIGFFINTICLRISQRVVSSLLPGSKDMSRNPLDLGKIKLQGLASDPLPMMATTHMDVKSHVFREVGRLNGQVFFSKDLFKPKTIHGMVSVFLKLPISNIALTNGLGRLCDETGSLGPDTAAYPRDSSVVDVFRARAAACPDATAVADSASSLTYRELDWQSDKLAAWLCRRNLAPESLVGVLSPRSCQTIIAFLGVPKSSLAYIPLNVNSPPGRIQTFLECTVWNSGVLESKDKGNNNSDPVAARGPSATSLAYCIFTSGSTGNPKGIMPENRAILRLVLESNVTAYIPEAPRVAHLCNLGLDISVQEIWTALLNGGTLVCVDYLTLLDSKQLEATFLQNGVNMDAADALKAKGQVGSTVLNAYRPTGNSMQSILYKVAR
ncbi:acetyl-CoA synthetase-like protein [Colletotrichum caudatum]|nr:acetyl-CoA synthetase-like protein [Colletotrichum caudatum]